MYFLILFLSIIYPFLTIQIKIYAYVSLIHKYLSPYTSNSLIFCKYSSISF